MEQLFDDLEDFGSFDDAISGDVRDPYTELARLRREEVQDPRLPVLNERGVGHLCRAPFGLALCAASATPMASRAQGASSSGSSSTSAGTSQ